MPFHPVHYYYGAGDWLWSIFSTLLFVALIVAAVMILARAFSASRHGGAGGAGAVGRPVAGPWFGPAGGGGRSAAEGAERILAERYARGEISEEEYRARLEVLRRASSAGWPSPQQPPPPPSQQQPAVPAPPAAGPSGERPPPNWEQPDSRRDVPKPSWGHKAESRRNASQPNWERAVPPQEQPRPNWEQPESRPSPSQPNWERADPGRERMEPSTEQKEPTPNQPQASEGQPESGWK